MIWIVLLMIATTAMLAGLAMVALKIGRDSDEEYGALTKNQLRALAYVVAFFICLIAVYVEWKVVIVEPEAERAEQARQVEMTE
ncbi:hypothetical protein KQI84_18400 [bacterium]|nr:hypothetical protein [bacterium]